ncbi:NUDIX domain-containing protein [Frigoribacterium sp. CFBP9039]|uniref:NUDIX hydrolase n=1 Tax=unclassified Frigoribacterium TaxID=2627005 RepID=UPI00177F987F|nr:MULTISPECIES: NUDIX domain-containing protein [unclassified Frigoribacterium]MBD8703557.1 NUDIX domain-containing protein [Frigoribacterium sp. CFBP 13712]MDY0945107.1 NUDIX domain-containing protein [Frigoribacterium sp. CFBP9039]
MTERVVRATSRLIVVDDDGRVLLMLTKAPDTSGVARWITPGGGVDPGETQAEAAIRELREETGQIITDPGDVVYVEDFVVPWDDADHTHGHAEFFIVRLPHFEIDDAGWTDDERVDILESRWFTIDELDGLDAADDAVEPAALVPLLRRIL